METWTSVFLQQPSCMVLNRAVALLRLWCLAQETVMHKKMLMPVLDKMGAATARPLCPLSASLCACFCYRGPAAEGGKDGTLRQLVFCSLWSPRGRTHVLWGGCVACWPAGASLGSPATALPVWQLSFVSELLSHPSYCGRASTLRRADFERKSFW